MKQRIMPCFNFSLVLIPIVIARQIICKKIKFNNALKLEDPSYKSENKVGMTNEGKIESIKIING